MKATAEQVAKYNEEAYNVQIKNEVKAEIKRLQQQNRYNRQRIKELKDKLK